MKKIPFTKMSGAGNDFIIIEALNGINAKRLAVSVCDRTDGIGADGLLILGRSKKADYKMRIINADGSEAEMCGNGIRCLAVYIAKTRKPKKKSFSIETKAGIILARINGEIANVRLSKPTGYTPSVLLVISGRKIHVPYINTGVPHTVVFVNDLENINVKTIGSKIRFHKKFQPRGTNVNFVEQGNKNYVAVRTYERGVEDETKACGTGSVASAIITYLKANPNVKNKKKASVRVKTSSNEILNICFSLINGIVDDVWLKGKTKTIAKGEYYV